eukprot:TRINITY_DN17986_c0_g1_i1.p1 TRINITY_DN17986_c0_g1~~TRINITY_DN17986_c0_g1_i1.p1  ORF type:complete len:717 (+),score=238.32 TRINITY_DN17986_c0_g1_i1:91-2241(+)
MGCNESTEKKPVKPKGATPKPVAPPQPATPPKAQEKAAPSQAPKSKAPPPPESSVPKPSPGLVLPADPVENIMEVRFKAQHDIKATIATYDQQSLPLEMQVKLLEEEKKLQHTRISKLMLAMQEKQHANNQKRESSKETKSVSKAEEEKMSEVFNRFDEDGSGAIDKDEFVKMVNELGVTLSEQDSAEAMDIICDGKSSKTVDFQSFAQWWNSDLTRGGKKGVALALARSKLRSLAVASGKGSKERRERDQSSIKAGVGVPVETDLTVHLGSLEVPRTSIKMSISNYSEAEFVKIADTRFSGVERPELENKEIYDAEMVEMNQGPIMFSEVALELHRPCPNEAQERRFLKNLERTIQIVCKNISKEIAPGWVWGSLETHELPIVTIKFAVAHATAEKSIVTALTGSPDPDAEDLEKLISQLEFQLDLGVNLDEFLRSMLEQAVSVLHIGDEGLAVKLKGRLAPAGLSTVVPLLSGSLTGGSRRSYRKVSAARDKKLFEMLAVNVAGLETELALGNPIHILEEASDAFVDKLREAIPEERRVAGIEDELNTVRMALVFLSTLQLEKTLTISNTPVSKYIESLMLLEPGRKEAMGWDNTDMSPIDVLFSFATFAKEVQSVKVWTKYQMVDLEADGLALFSLLPSNRAEVKHYLTKRRVSRKLQSDFAAVQYAKLPILKEEIDHSATTHGTRIVWEALESVLDAIKELEGEQLRLATPG